MINDKDDVNFDDVPSGGYARFAQFVCSTRGSIGEILQHQNYAGRTPRLGDFRFGIRNISAVAPRHPQTVPIIVASDSKF